MPIDDDFKWPEEIEELADGEMPNDLPDLPVLVWKLLRVLDPVQKDRVFGPEGVTPLTDAEQEYLRWVLDAPCPECSGRGEFPDGLVGTVECKTCKGHGR